MVACDINGKELRVGDKVRRISFAYISEFLTRLEKMELGYTKDSILIVRELESSFNQIRVSFKDKYVTGSWDANKFEIVENKKIEFDDYKKEEEYV